MTISRQAVLDKLDSIAQDATLSTQLDTTLSALATAIAGATPKTQAEMWTRLDEILTKLNAGVTVDGTVNVGANVLATDAATETKQDAAKLVLDDIDTGITALNAGVDATLVGSTIFETGNIGVTTAGTRVQLDATTACSQLIIKAEHSNTGDIYVGDVTVTDAVYGVRLEPGEQVTLPIANVNMVYVDADVNGESVSYIAT